MILMVNAETALGKSIEYFERIAGNNTYELAAAILQQGIERVASGISKDSERFDSDDVKRKKN